MSPFMSRVRRRLLEAMGGLMVLMATAAHAGSVTYVYTDPQGTPLAEADASGNITATYDYAPYGSQALGSPPNGPGYTGHVNDPDTGLVYMQARYYDPAVGRFLSTDPVTPSAGSTFNFNRFAYANNSPIDNMDPDGRHPDDPLFMLTWTNQVINDAYQDNIVKPVKTAYNKVDNSAVVTINVAAASGIGPSYEINALHPEKRRLGFVVGEGANASIDIAPKRGFSMALGNNTNSTSLLASADFLAGDIFHGGFSLTLDANLNLTIIPKAGFGMGELMTFKKFGVSGAAGLSDEVVSGHHEEKHPDNKSSVSEPGCYLEECERGRPFPEMKRGGS